VTSTAETTATGTTGSTGTTVTQTTGGVAVDGSVLLSVVPVV
jgi:hypothetical protein